MIAVYAFLGFIAGALVAGSGEAWMLGALGGAVIAILAARQAQLDQRLRQLESAADRRRRERPRAAEAPPATAPAKPDSRPADPWREARPAGAQPAPPSPWRAYPESPALEPSILQRLSAWASAWLSAGNLPARLGVLVSFIGVAFLLKYAIDRRLLVVAIEFRLLAVALAGVALLVVGWRLRGRERVYALILQGGGVGILYLTIFAALQLWQLLSAPLAFLLLVALTFMTGALAVMQNARPLATLGTIGGFLAPVLAATGHGDHVVLFGYYLVLNTAVLGIAWYRAWRGLNLLGWVFTFLVGSLWGYQYYRPELFASTQPFLVLYFLFYQAIAILFALRQPPERLGYVDGTLVFGTPVIAFALQAALTEDMPYGLAISAAVIAAFYAATALWLWRGRAEKLRLLVESFTALAVAFGTLAIPLALDARWTSAAWALEGAALVWIGTRQGRPLARLAGAALIFLSGAAFFDDGWRNGAGWPLLNGNVLGGLLVGLSALFAARKLDTGATQTPAVKLISSLLFAWGGLWWLATGWMEITDRIGFGSHDQTHAMLLFLALSAGAAVLLGRVRDWAKMRRATLLLLPSLAPLALVYHGDFGHLLSGLGWLAWPLAVSVQYLVLRIMDEDDAWSMADWHLGSVLLFTVLLAFEVSWWVGRAAPGAWENAAGPTVAGAVALLLWRARQRPAWPVPAHPAAYRSAGFLLVAGQAVSLAALGVLQPGDDAPWPYVPVLNAFDLAMLFAMVTALRPLAVLRKNAAGAASAGFGPAGNPYRLLLAAAFFAMTTCAVVRGVHHYAGVAWGFDALFESTIVQTALSIYWGLLGFGGMVGGARRQSRPVWIAGAGFMALVVVKLFLVDLGNSGTVERIVSFIGTGALLLVVGYFAPAPPRAG